MREQPVNICGQHIAKQRALQKSPLTQQDLAARLQTLGIELDRAGIAKIETQKRRVCDFELLGFSKALNVSISDLLGDE